MKKKVQKKKMRKHMNYLKTKASIKRVIAIMELDSSVTYGSQQ